MGDGVAVGGIAVGSGISVSTTGSVGKAAIVLVGAMVGVTALGTNKPQPVRTSTSKTVSDVMPINFFMNAPVRKGCR